MLNNSPVITAVLSLHREGELLRTSFRSLLKACRCLSREGVAWELICILDRSDDETRRVARDEISKLKALGEEVESHEVDKGDLGLSRNEAANIAHGQFIGFLDGDDLCSEEWLLRAYRCCAADNRQIAHPAANIYFGRNAGIFVHPNQSEYNVRSLFFHNLWTALSFAARDVYRSLPYERNELNSGLGYEDWNFNCRSIAAGYRHIAVPQTCHFIRVKAQSEGLCEQSADKLCVIKRVPLWQWLAKSGGAELLSVRDDELSRLVAHDPPTIQTDDLPQWIRDEMSSQSPPIELDGSVANISPPRTNKLAPFLSDKVLERIAAGIQELHFVTCASAIVQSSPSKLVVADVAPDEGERSEDLTLSELEQHLHERIVLFVGALIVQTGCSVVHLWDSSRAPSLIAKLGELIQRCKVTVVWHQMAPGGLPAPGLLTDADTLPEGWRMRSEVSAGGAAALIDLDAPRERGQLRVLFLVDSPRDRNPWASQSVWYRVIGPGEALKERGHQVFYGLLGEADKWRLIVETNRCDIVVLHRPTMSQCFQGLRRSTRERGIPLVYEVDDNIMAPDEVRQAQHLQDRTRRELDAIAAWASGNVRCLSECDAAILATPELQVIAEKYQPKSYLAPNFIPGFYRPPAEAPDASGRNPQYFTVFYGPGSLEHSVYLESIGSELLRSFGAIPNARLLLGGGLPLPQSLLSIRHRVIHLPRVTPQFYMQCLANVDLVLAPVLLDSFSRCKSWIKALEAAAMGTPWIGSALPDYVRFAAQSKTGTVVMSGESWAQAITQAHAQVTSGVRSAPPAEAPPSGSVPSRFEEWMPNRAQEYAELLRRICSAHTPIRLAQKKAVTSAVKEDREPIHCQVYWSCALGGFSEDRSLRCRVVHEGIATYSFDIEAPAISRLRIDPVDSVGQVEVVEILIRSLDDGRVIFRADERGGWGRLEISGAEVERSGVARLKLLARDIDPQMHLPIMREPVDRMRVSITMQTQPGLQTVVSKKVGLGWVGGWFRQGRAGIRLN